MKYEDYKELGSETAVKVWLSVHMCISHIHEVGVVGMLYMCSDPGMPLTGYHYGCHYGGHEMSGADLLNGHNNIII